METIERPNPVPRAWMEEKPDWFQPGTKIKVTPDGRAAGYFASGGSAC